MLTIFLSILFFERHQEKPLTDFTQNQFAKVRIFSNIIINIQAFSLHYVIYISILLFLN
jgi:hypothetical protein